MMGEIKFQDSNADFNCWGCGYAAAGPITFCPHCQETHHFVSLPHYALVKRGFNRELLDRLGPVPEPPMDKKVTNETFTGMEQPKKRSDRGHNVPLACNVVPDRMTEHYDYAVGAVIDSRSQKKRVYKDNDMIMVSAAEEARKKGMPTLKCKVRSYPGQKDRRSSSERWTGARTKTGQQVV